MVPARSPAQPPDSMPDNVGWLGGGAGRNEIPSISEAAGTATIISNAELTYRVFYVK